MPITQQDLRKIRLICLTIIAFCVAFYGVIIFIGVDLVIRATTFQDKLTVGALWFGCFVLIPAIVVGLSFKKMKRETDEDWEKLKQRFGPIEPR